MARTYRKNCIHGTLLTGINFDTGDFFPTVVQDKDCFWEPRCFRIAGDRRVVDDYTSDGREPGRLSRIAGKRALRAELADLDC